MDQNKNLILGLDCGTSSIKLVLLNININQIEYEDKISTNSARIKTENGKFNEQNVDVILSKIKQILDRIPDNLLDRLKGAQLCGQMHGIVLWNKTSKTHSSLITWQDERCDENFIKNLPVKSISNVNSGYGCANLFWFETNSLNPEYKTYDSAGTIHDYVTYLLSGKVLMSNQNALSWGYFDLESNYWQKELLKCDKFPHHLLPEVAYPGEQISERINCFGKLIDVPIFNALGDLQCSVMSCLENDNDCVINISTSAQACVIINKDLYTEIKSQLPLGVDCFAYTGNKYLLAAASLNGGNVLENLIDSFINWNKDLGVNTEINRDNLWQKLIELGEKSNGSLKCEPTFFGERHDRQTYASFLNIRNDNFNIGDIFKSLCDGIVSNLHQMITKDLILKLKCNRIIATGGALARNTLLKKSLESEFNYIPIVYRDSTDAAYGAALFLKNSIKIKNI